MKSLTNVVLRSIQICIACTLPVHIGNAWETKDPTAKPPGAATTPSAPVNTDYKINPGDVLNVSVWREEDLKLDVLVRPDGKISFPLAGDVQAAGLVKAAVNGVGNDWLVRDKVQRESSLHGKCC